MIKNKLDLVGLTLSSPPKSHSHRTKMEKPSKMTEKKMDRRKQPGKSFCDLHFKCSCCDAAFVRKDSLQSHLRQHAKQQQQQQTSSSRQFTWLKLTKCVGIQLDFDAIIWGTSWFRTELIGTISNSHWLYWHRDILSTDIFSTDTFSTSI